MYALKFIREFLRAPGDVGALTASSRQLGEAVTDHVGLESAATVVEFGPGTGAITEVIVERLRPGTTFFAIEKSEDFVKALRTRFPDVKVFHDSAENTRRYLAKFGVNTCDCIVSGLPWASFPEPLQDRLLDAALDVLRPGGWFSTYTYVSSQFTPAAVRFRKKLTARFDNVGKSPIVWNNFPPAFAYYAMKRTSD